MNQMASDPGKVEKITALLHEAGKNHHSVYRITDGAHDDWASWYSQWLIELSELPEILGTKPVPSELTWLLVKLGKEYDEAEAGMPWQSWYAGKIAEHFAA
ncbi:MAG: hypothetical protein ACRDIU_04485 [Actinomycetota bacterium]